MKRKVPVDISGNRGSSWRARYEVEDHLKRQTCWYWLPWQDCLLVLFSLEVNLPRRLLDRLQVSSMRYVDEDSVSDLVIVPRRLPPCDISILGFMGVVSAVVVFEIGLGILVKTSQDFRSSITSQVKLSTSLGPPTKIGRAHV